MSPAHEAWLRCHTHAAWVSPADPAFSTPSSVFTPRRGSTYGWGPPRRMVKPDSRPYSFPPERGVATIDRIQCKLDGAAECPWNPPRSASTRIRYRIDVRSKLSTAPSHCRHTRYRLDSFEISFSWCDGRFWRGAPRTSISAICLFPHPPPTGWWSLAKPSLTAPPLHQHPDTPTKMAVRRRLLANLSHP